MIDYAHIPLHIRITGRNKIDPSYPSSDARWWELQELTARNAKARATNRPQLNEFQQQIADYVMENSPVGAIELARHFGVPSSRIYTSIMGAASVYPIWEVEQRGLIIFGYLKGGEDES